MESRTFKESIWTLDPEQLNYAARCIQGKAQFEREKGVSLSLPFGRLLSRAPDSSGVIRHSIDDVLAADAVYGFSQDGYAQTLVDVIDVGSGYAIPGASYQTLRGHKMYAAKATGPIPPNPAIVRFSLRMVGLREWAGLSPISETLRYDDDGDLQEHVVSYSQSDALSIVLHDGQAVRISLNPTYAIEGGSYPAAYFEHAVDADYSLDLSFSDAIALDDAFEKWVLPVRNFLSFCMGFQGPINELRFTTNDGRSADYYVSVAEGPKPSNSRLRSIPLSWKQCGEIVPSMLNSWLGFGSQARDASLRAVSLLRDPDLPLDMLFLVAAQAFEAISRDGRSPHVIDAEEHDERMNDIMVRLGDSANKSWVKDRLARSNIKSANQFAREQIEELGDFASYVVPDTGTYLKEHRATRNFYSHLEGSSNKRRLEPGERMLANENATFLLLYGSICLRLGLTSAEILEAVKSSRFMDYGIYRARKHYARAENEKAGIA